MQRGWNFFRAERNEYLDILPASQRVSENKWYLGTADAVTQNIDMSTTTASSTSSCSRATTVYKMDYEVMLRQHVEDRRRCDRYGLPHGRPPSMRAPSA